MRKNNEPEPNHIKLVDLTKDDLATYREWFLESNPSHQTCRPIGDLSLEAMIAGFHERSLSDTSRDFAIRRLDDNCFIGRLTYFDLNIRNRAVEIGFLIGPDFRRQGYAQEAVTLLLDHLFNELGMNKVMAQTGEFNIAAVSLLKKLRFKQDGRLRRHHLLDNVYYDSLIFSLLCDEFRALS
jgi:ribosomal-protein-alanine N-acetyltransferase